MSALDKARRELQAASVAFHAHAQKHGRPPTATSAVGTRYYAALARCAQLEREYLAALSVERQFNPIVGYDLTQDHDICLEHGEVPLGSKECPQCSALAARRRA